MQTGGSFGLKNMFVKNNMVLGTIHIFIDMFTNGKQLRKQLKPLSDRKPLPQFGDKRTRIKFAWFPVITEDRVLVWLEKYIAHYWKTMERHTLC